MQRRAREGAAAAVCGEYLDVLCETTSKVLAVRKSLTEKMQVNIKAIKKEPGTDTLAYEVIAWSANPDTDRMLDDDSKPARQLHDNAFYVKILSSKGTVDYCNVPHIEKFLEATDITMQCAHPDPRRTPGFYKSALVVAVQGPKSSILDANMPVGRAAESFGNDNTILGFICADTKEYDAFDLSWDLQVLREMASKAFNALRMHYSAHSSGRIPPLRRAS